MLNRMQIFAAIDNQIALRSAEAQSFAVLIVHVRGLREIGIRFGLANGEQAEENARRVIEQALRPTDKVFHAGDESFAVVLSDMRTQSHALLAATQLMEGFEQPLNSAASPWHVHAIIGAAFFPEHGRDADQLCRRAEMAVDEAERNGEPFAFYEQRATKVEILYEELRDGIESNRLQVYFQPIRDFKAQRVSGVESLARWTSPSHGEVSPEDFVPFAERSDLISTLTRWSINATLRHAAALRDVADFNYAINLSPRVFANSGLVEQILDALSIWNLSPSTLTVEVTETALVNDLDLTVRVLRRLRDHGVRISIDDFGTGYTSITYLRKFPATELKIDKSLISNIGFDGRTAKLVGAMITLAHNMDLATVAEGIEDQATQDLLIDMGCDFGQGYHLGRPRSATELIADYASMKQT